MTDTFAIIDCDLRSDAELYVMQCFHVTVSGLQSSKILLSKSRTRPFDSTGFYAIQPRTPDQIFATKIGQFRECPPDDLWACVQATKPPFPARVGFG